MLVYHMLWGATAADIAAETATTTADPDDGGGDTATTPGKLRRQMEGLMGGILEQEELQQVHLRVTFPIVPPPSHTPTACVCTCVPGD